MPTIRLLKASLVVCLGALQGCEGSTEPAVEPGPDAAIAYVGGGSSSIWIMSPDGINRLKVAPPLASSPACSPDGSKILFIHRALPTGPSHPAGTPRLFIVNADGSGSREITVADTFLGGAGWSPDGQRFAVSFRTHQSPQSTGVALMNADGTGFTALAGTDSGGAKGYTPSWSPNGREVLYTSGGDVCCNDVIAVNVLTGATRFVTSSGRAARWSPDGRNIAFLQGVPFGPTQLVVMDKESVDRRVVDVPTDWSGSGSFTWSRDSRRILFLESDGGLHSVDVEGGELKLVAPSVGDEWIGAPHMCGTP